MWWFLYIIHPWLDVMGRAGGIMSPSLNCRHIIATLRFQLNFQGAFFRGRGERGGRVGVKGILLDLTKARSALQPQYLSQIGEVVKIVEQIIHRLKTHFHTHTHTHTHCKHAQTVGSSIVGILFCFKVEMPQILKTFPFSTKMF